MSADARLRSLIDRILRLKEEQDTIGEDIKEIYAEAKGDGYDKTAMGSLVSELRKKGKDAAKFEEASSMLDLYREAYERASGTAVATHTHTPERLQSIPQSSSPAPSGAKTTAADAVLPVSADTKFEREVVA